MRVGALAVEDVVQLGRHVALRAAVLVIAVALGVGVGTLDRALRTAEASRDGSGNYTAPSNSMNPAVPGTPMKSADWNTIRNDLAIEMQDSLSRSAKGGMLASLRLVDGTVSAPGLAFNNETGSGLFRNAASDVRMAIAGSLRQQWTSTGTAITGTVSATGAWTGGLTIGSGGTAIGSSVSGSYTIDFASIAGNTCLNSGNQTLTGAAQNSTCVINAPSQGAVIPHCNVNGANQIIFFMCNVTTGAIDPPSQTFRVMVFNP